MDTEWNREALIEKIKKDHEKQLETAANPRRVGDIGEDIPGTIAVRCGDNITHYLVRSQISSFQRVDLDSERFPGKWTVRCAEARSEISGIIEPSWDEFIRWWKSGA